jgi:hypothetical protein
MKTIKEFLGTLTTELDLQYNYQDDMTFNEFEEAIDTYIRESSDVIYYSKAMEFLQEHDPSLRESLGLASDLGYDPSDLNSEILATLLNQQKLFEEWSELSSEIEEYFDEYEKYLELEGEKEEI